MEFKLKFRSDRWTEFDVGNISFALHGGGKPNENSGGTTSIGFDVEDIEKTYQDLSAKGVTFTLSPTLRQSEGIKLAVAQDLDGFAICFTEKI